MGTLIGIEIAARDDVQRAVAIYVRKGHGVGSACAEAPEGRRSCRAVADWAAVKNALAIVQIDDAVCLIAGHDIQGCISVYITQRQAKRGSIGRTEGLAADEVAEAVIQVDTALAVLQPRDDIEFAVKIHVGDGNADRVILRAAEAADNRPGC